MEAITDASGALKERLSFDAWGERQRSNWTAGDPTMGLPLLYPTQKGYTGHEQIDQLGLVHMGGRVYDPVVSRFLSADIYVTQPGNSQTYNRYSYVRNNPLKFTDPSGYSEKDARKAPPPPVEEVVITPRPSAPPQLGLGFLEFHAFMAQYGSQASFALTPAGTVMGTISTTDGGKYNIVVESRLFHSAVAANAITRAKRAGGEGKDGNGVGIGFAQKGGAAYQTSFGDGKDDSDLKFTSGLQAGARVGLTKLLGAKLDLDFASHEISLVTGKNFANQSFALSVDVAGFSLGFDASRNVEFGRLKYGENSVLGILSGRPFEFKPVFSTPWNVSAKEFWRLDLGASAIFGVEGTVDFAQ